MEPPERLLKKKCTCGEQLKFFAIVGLPYLPEWIAVAIYYKELELETLLAMPGIISSNLIHGICFTATCSECGQITAWHLKKDEVDYLIGIDKEEGYGIAWVNSIDNIEKQFGNFPFTYVRDNMKRIAHLLAREEHKGPNAEYNNG